MLQGVVDARSTRTVRASYYENATFKSHIFKFSIQTVCSLSALDVAQNQTVDDVERQTSQAKLGAKRSAVVPTSHYLNVTKNMFTATHVYISVIKHATRSLELRKFYKDKYNCASTPLKNNIVNTNALRSRAKDTKHEVLHIEVTT